MAGEIKTILAKKGLDGGDFWQGRLAEVSRGDVEKVLVGVAGSYSLERLAVLISPAAEDYLEEMARQAQRLTVQRFGRTIRLYAPLYVSNYCSNSCLYCGFNRQSEFERTRLTIDEAVVEAELIAAEGFRDILLVSSEDRKFINVDYLSELARRLRGKFSSISVEIYQMNEEEYRKLFEAGIDGVTLYQETYERGEYCRYHPAGAKSDYDNRLESLGRAASAGMREIGFGVLLGLSDWRVEALAMAEHAHYLIKHYWKSHVSFSFPRLRPAHEVEGSQFAHLLERKSLAQMMMALRLCFADAGLVLSTREGAELRDDLIKLGVTRLSAGSKTNPGGYSSSCDSVKQFEVDDNRSAGQVAEMLKGQGFEAVWKDWDEGFKSD